MILVGAMIYLSRSGDSRSPAIPAAVATSSVPEAAGAGTPSSPTPPGPAPAGATAPGSAAIVLAKPMSAAPAQAAAAGPLKAPVASAEAPAKSHATLGVQTRSRYEAGQLWLKTVPNERWFIQLLGSDIGQAAAIENFVSRSVEQLGAEQLRVYVTNFRGVERVGVIYGEYPSRESALRAIQQLPAAVRALSPFPRLVKHLR